MGGCVWREGMVMVCGGLYVEGGGGDVEAV